MFALLLEYKGQHGDCDVPHKWPHDQQLAHWVKNQRLATRLAKLREDRVRQLNDIGFQWSTRERKSGTTTFRRKTERTKDFGNG
jgi:hypothetical protein